MNSRDTILKSVQSSMQTEIPLPDIQPVSPEQASLRSIFCEMVSTVGGSCHHVARLEEMESSVKQQSTFQEATLVCSAYPVLQKGELDSAAVKDPHELQDVDLAIFPAEFGVAENGAVWVTDHNVPHRVIYFLAQHLILVLSAKEIVPHLHKAYEKLTFHDSSFGTFISGPSKTADIEQSLVIGAHGARSLTIYLVEEL